MGELLIIVALSFIGSTFLVETAFPYVSQAKRLLKLKILPLDMRLIAYFWLVVGYPSDVLFNYTRGWWMMREFPPERLFSGTVQHYINRGGTARQVRKAELWARILNANDEGHIRIPDGYKWKYQY